MPMVNSSHGPLITSGGSTGVAWGGLHGVAEATPKMPHATPQATRNENMNFGT